VAGHWGRADEGVWEVRGGGALRLLEFMCWVALDRGLRLADKRPSRRTGRLAEGRDAVYEE